MWRKSGGIGHTKVFSEKYSAMLETHFKFYSLILTAIKIFVGVFQNMINKLLALNRELTDLIEYFAVSFLVNIVPCTLST